MSDVGEGIYSMDIFFIGYAQHHLDSLVISKSRPMLSLGDITLVNKLTTLKEAIVISEKNIIENKIDKMIYHADKDITSQTGVATDILKKIPQVAIDIDGNVELQGNAGIRFLINGKPSTIFGNSIADVLQAIPASQVESVEIITSPGAKYDAEGTAGIINIILKKNNAEGINGSVSLSASTRLENGSLNLNAHHGRFSINTFVSGNAQVSHGTKTYLNRTSQDSLSRETSQLLQNAFSDFTRNGYEAGIGFDWDIAPEQNISGSIGYDFFGNKNTGRIDRHSVIQAAEGLPFSDVYDLITTSNKFHENAFDYAFNYKKTFATEDQELNISTEGSLGRNLSYYAQTKKYSIPDSLAESTYGNDPGIENDRTLAIDYTQPFGEKFILETGAQSTFNVIKSNADVYVREKETGLYQYNATLSSRLDYRSNIHAAYLSTTIKLGEVLDVKPGFRFEYTAIKANFSSAGEVNIKPYSTYVPSLAVSHTFSNHQTITISYSHRIERPEYRDLNPFINASDPKNITTGNTNLRPEIGNKIELGYSRYFDKGMAINTSLFYRGNLDDIQSFTKYYPVYEIGDSMYYNVAVSTRENIGQEDNIGVSFFISFPATSKLTFRSNISGYQRFIYNKTLPGSNVQGFNYRTNLNAAYQVSSTMSIEMFGNFNSPRISAQGKMPSFTTYNFAIREQFFHKKASLALTMTNPFNRYITQETELKGQNFNSFTRRELPYRSFGINFTYKFGRLDFKKDNEREDVNLNSLPPEN